MQHQRNESHYFVFIKQMTDEGTGLIMHVESHCFGFQVKSFLGCLVLLDFLFVSFSPFCFLICSPVLWCLVFSRCSSPCSQVISILDFWIFLGLLNLVLSHLLCLPASSKGIKVIFCSLDLPVCVWGHFFNQTIIMTLLFVTQDTRTSPDKKRLLRCRFEQMC